MAQTKIRGEQIDSILLSQVSNYVPVTATDSSEIDFTVTGQDITGSLKTTTVNAGTYSASNITVDSKGRITSASDGSVSAVASINGRVTLGSFFESEMWSNGDLSGAILNNGAITKENALQHHPGIYRINSTTNAIGNGYRWAMSANPADDLILNGGEKAILIFRTPTSFTSFDLTFGFCNVLSGAVTEGTYFKIDGTSSIVGTNVSGGSTESTSSLATLSASTWYRLELTITSVLNSNFALYNDAGTLINSAQVTRYLPTTAITGVCTVVTKTTTTTALGLYDYIGFATGLLTR